MSFVMGWFQLLWSPRVKARLKQYLLHLKLYEKRLEELKGCIRNLQKAKDAVQHKVDEEDNRYGRGIPDDVREWIRAVNVTISEFEEFKKEEGDHQLAVFDLFKSGYLPKTGIRYHRSIQAFDITRRVNGLLHTANHDTFSNWLGPPSMDAFFHTVGYESFPSRTATMKRIKETLESPNIRMVGLHGPSGVGKTTLVKFFASEALQTSEGPKMFDVVAMVNVTRSPDVRKIQGQIADMVGMKLDEESDIARAARIRRRLKNEKESTLIILDDLWEALDLKMLGIPFGSDGDSEEHSRTKTMKETPSGNVKEGNSGKKKEAIGMMKSRTLPSVPSSVKTEEALSHYKGCKVLLISESKQVLLSQTEGMVNSIYHVDVLKEIEAEVFFKKMAGIGDRNPEFMKLAAQIANRCNGLPMSIVTTARALKNQSRSVWDDVLRKLERGNLTGAFGFSTKLSYDLLEDEELKYAFLLCARMGPDALIMDLVKYCIGLGFLQEIYTVKEARDRVYVMVGKLKMSGLLSDSYSSDHFTMSDIVRSAALLIASKEKNVYTKTKGKIDEWPEPDKLQRYSAISLHHCHIIEGFPRTINCPRLRVFHVNNNDLHLEIPKNFFKGMKELRVLILAGIRISPLDSSIASLTELRMLSMQQCMLDKELSCIGDLKKLRILSFSGSDIEKLPVELKQLKKLQIFDISNCSKLRVIPSNVISSLISLEELYMRNTLIQWEVQEHQSENASLSELRRLNQLTTIDIQILDATHLPKSLFFDKLYNYKIVIGDLNAHSEMNFKMPEKYEASKFLAIQLKDGVEIHSKNGLKMLFERVEHLFLEDLNGVKDIFYTLNLKGFLYLRHLSVVNNSSIQSLIKPKERQHSEKAFPKLESLYLHDLHNLSKICSCKISASSFGKLKVIRIILCVKLSNVISTSAIGLLSVLETIEVSECYALKEIVEVEAQSSSDKIKVEFPELRSLTLQSLSGNFIGLYPISSTEGTLFNGKVKFSKLEKIQLSSIHIDKIWSAQLLQRSFQNLIHLDVNGCWNLEYLTSFSIAKSLESLQSLFVCQCQKMTNLFLLEQSDAIMQGSIFPNLKNIKLSSMKSLGEIWNSELPSNSFGKLDTLIIEDCDKLVSVFPCYIEGIFKSLCNLRVTNCESMQTIFDLDDIKGNAGDLTNLKDVHLETLPKLENVWRSGKDWDGILKLNNLQKMWVHECDSLENIFPFAIARCLHNLEYLVIWDYFELRQIVANLGTSNHGILFVFPKLATVKFLKLPRLACFYPEAYKISWPALIDLSIELCDRLNPFKKEATDAQEVTQEATNAQPTLFSEEVINKLKSMHIESWHAKSSSSYIGEGNHRGDKLEELCLSRLVNPEILYSFLHSNPYLKSLSLTNCSVTDIVPFKMPSEIINLGVVPQLKILKLINLPDLCKIGFERDINLQRIEFLILKNCPCLINLMPSSVSLTQLTYLEVVNCDALTQLMSLLATEGLVQLNSMKVIECKSMVEIVENQEENAAKVNIVFRKLKVLELVSLKNLNCFSKGSVFEFPSLEKLVVSACPKMETFCREVKSTPLLQKIFVEHEKEKIWCWRDDLNTTIQEMFMEKKFYVGMDEISLSEHDHLLQEAWNCSGSDHLNRSWFYSLKYLTIEDCENLSCAIPSNILPHLRSLIELQVRNCNKVKVIFEKNDIEATPFQLKWLTLEGLHELEHVWEKNCKGNLKFQNLQSVSVSVCHRLQTVFPAGLAKNIENLETLEIIDCRNLLEIVGKEKDAVEKFVFPCLTELYLDGLPKLTYFYRGTFTVEIPELRQLTVLECPEFELFQAMHPEGGGEGTSISIDRRQRQPLFSDLEAPSLLEELLIDWNHLSRLRHLTKDLKFLKSLWMFFGEDDDPTFLFDILLILKKAPNLQDMDIVMCNSLKIFHIPPNLENRELEFFAHLKMLTLTDVSQLEYVKLDESWLPTAYKKLHKLNVSSCNNLTTLFRSPNSAQVSLSFLYLKELIITECSELKNLFTSWFSESLMNLEMITVSDCDAITEIVAKGEQGGKGIKFQHLYWVSLTNLPELKCFYSGNDTLQVPSLTEVQICNCPKMKVLSGGEIDAKSFRGIRATNDPSDSKDDLIFHDGLNASVKRHFLLLLLSEGKMDKGFSEYPDELKEAWENGHSLQNNFWKKLNLDYSVVKKFAIPSNILPFLNSLQELTVQTCNSINFFRTQNPKVIEYEILGQLQILTLIEVSDLTCINLEDSLNRVSEMLRKLSVEHCPDLREIFRPTAVSLSHLKELKINHCDGLEYLFTSSVVKLLMNLEMIEVMDCKSIKEIVANEQHGTAASQGIKFERLEYISLCSLSSLQCFYLGNDTLQLPSLTRVNIHMCPNIEVFSQGAIDGSSSIGTLCSDLLGEIFFNNDLNATVERIRIFQLFLLEVKAILLKVVPDRCFRNLGYLVMKGCEFLSDVILPSHIFPFLNCLRTLEVQECNSVKAVFAYTHIGPHGRQTSLPNLNTLSVENCEKEDANEEIIIIMLPRIAYLRLRNLYNLSCIYGGMNILKCPMLSEIDVMHCPMLSFFATNSQSSGDSHSDSSPTNQQAFVSLEKVTPRMRRLSLGEEEAKMIEQGKLHLSDEMPKNLTVMINGEYQEGDTNSVIMQHLRRKDNLLT